MDDINEKLENKLGEVTRAAHELEIPVMILIEGAPASGKSRLANALYMALDAKYTNFIAARPPREAYVRYPFLQRYWYHLPPEGDINIHFRSWYSQYIELKDYYKATHTPFNMAELEEDMENFEETLINNDYEIIKLFINTDKEARERHIKKLKGNPVLKWKAEEFQGLLKHHDYDEEMSYFINRQTLCPWEVVNFHNSDQAVNDMYKILIDRLESRIERASTAEEPVVDGKFTRDFETKLFTFDFDKEKMKKKDYQKRLPLLQEKMREIQFQLYEHKIPLILVYEGMDAAGKGGNIKHTRALLDPTGYTNNAIGAPSDIELSHHYLWRFANRIPRTGHIGFFDRSWYGRVLVERVEGFATMREWQQAYQEINDFEKSLSNAGAIIIKFFLSLDKEEQLERFRDRENTPEKAWKITEEDWRNRDKWDLYLEASEDMINYTSTKIAPWCIISSNNKRYARITALETIIKMCESRLKKV